MRVAKVFSPLAARVANATDLTQELGDIAANSTIDWYVRITAISGAGCALTVTIDGNVFSGATGTIGDTANDLVDGARVATGLYRIGNTSNKYTHFTPSWTIANPGSVTFEIVAVYDT